MINDYNKSDCERDEEKIRKLISKWAKANRPYRPLWSHKGGTYEDDANLLMRFADKTSKVETYGGCFWNQTRILSEYMTDNIEFDYDKNDDPYISDIPNPYIRQTTVWNQVLRMLGYEGVADYEGEGIIHPAEPIQSVFFQKSSIEILDFELNKERREPDDSRDHEGARVYQKNKRTVWIELYKKEGYKQVLLFLENIWKYHKVSGDTKPKIPLNIFKNVVVELVAQYRNRTGATELFLELNGFNSDLTKYDIEELSKEVAAKEGDADYDDENSEKVFKRYWDEVRDQEMSTKTLNLDSFKFTDKKVRGLTPLLYFTMNEITIRLPKDSKVKFKDNKKEQKKYLTNIFQLAKTKDPKVAATKYFNSIFEESK